ncbi:hypothetical protein TGVAND_435490, partial [Toxoplasma gondii VAND]
ITCPGGVKIDRNEGLVLCIYSASLSGKFYFVHGESLKGSSVLLYQCACNCLLRFFRLDAYHLLEASQSETAAKSALSDLNWFSDLADIYSGQQTMAEMDVALKAQGEQKLSYPIQGKNIK